MTTTEQEWLSAYATGLGVAAPREDERNDILALAGVAAHASARTAAPIACWLAARAGVSAREALALAAQLSVSENDALEN